MYVCMLEIGETIFSSVIVLAITFALSVVATVVFSGPFEMFPYDYP